MPINELAVDAGGTLYASVAGGEVKHSTDGGKTWSRLVEARSSYGSSRSFCDDRRRAPTSIVAGATSPPLALSV